jgi:hypothetical protein
MIPVGIRRTVFSAFAACAGIAIAGLFLSSLRSVAPAQAQAQPANTPKALFQEKCAACHDLPDPQQLMYTRRQWRLTVNEMLYQHGALYNPQTHAGITTLEGDTIVDYLSQFAPRPGRQRPANPTDTGPDDVWSTEPLQSRSFTFSTEDDLSAFDQEGGVWKIVPSESAGESYLKSRPGSDSPASLLVEKKDSVSGDMDLRVSFKPFQTTGHTTIGLLIGYQDPKDYSAVEFDPTSQGVSYIVVAQGQPTVTQTQTFPVSGTAGPGGWHTLRVVEHNNGQSLTAWLDFQKRLTGSDPNAKASGHVGLYAGGGAVAAFQQMTLDIYPSASSTGLFN